MELLPLLQGLSTPVLLVIVAIAWRAKDSVHDIDKRLSVIETKVSSLKHEVNKIT